MDHFESMPGKACPHFGKRGVVEFFAQQSHLVTTAAKTKFSYPPPPPENFDMSPEKGPC